MFYERYLKLCAAKKISPSTAATNAGFNRGTVSVWKKKFESGIDVTPDPDVIDKICAYFNCSEQWLRGIEQEKAPTLTKKDERDIARDLEQFIQDMDNSGDLMFDGDPLSPEARESVIAAMKLGLQAAKLKNKERFTPKKYRGDSTKKE